MTESILDIKRIDETNELKTSKLSSSLMDMIKHPVRVQSLTVTLQTGDPVPPEILRNFFI